MSDLTQPGAFNLGAILAGGGRVREAAKTAEEMRLIQRAQLQAETDRKVDQAIEEKHKRAGIETVAADQSLDPLVRALTLGGLGSDYSGATSGNLHQQEYETRAAALKAALAGDLNTANANLFGVANGPVDLAKIEDHTVLNPTVVGGGNLQTNAVGQAVIGATNALAGQRNAAANLSNVKAAAGGFKPSATGAGKPVPFTTPQQGSLVKAFSHSDGTYDNADENEFDQWRMKQAAIDPRYNNGEFALAAYKAGESADMEDQHTLVAVIRDREAQGLPPLSPTQKRDLIQQFRRTGKMSVPVSLDEVSPVNLTEAIKGVAYAPPSMPAKQEALAKPVHVTTPAEAKAAWASLPSGASLVFPNGTVKIKP